MKYIKKINWVLVTLLCLTAGATKILKIQEEVNFFHEVGLSESFLLPFGLFQFVAGLLLIFSKTRKQGALLSTIIFALSSIMIFSTGDLRFGLFSILPILMSYFVIKYSKTSNATLA